jgi:bacteriophage N4 adsorption protein B
VDGVLAWMEFWQRELLLFSAVWFLIGALDDVAIDLIWFVRWVYRRWTYYRKCPPLRVYDLPFPVTTGLLAVFVATWQEAEVIGAMLGHCFNGWRNQATKYRIYVGCYPNDAAGVDAIMDAAQYDPHIRMVLCANTGPTTKADCLNRLWQALTRDELMDGTKAKAIILHDAEDRVHPDELRLYDLLIERNQVVQIPVIPIQVPGSPWISGHYLDEFAEAHGKSLVVREAIGAALPLAGVGCAIDRNILGRIALENDHRPFDSSSLTEDYELGLRIGALGGRTILARVHDENGQIVGTRACFPDTIEGSVRQKTRWLTGIALVGWDRVGWQGSLAEYWMLVRDRKVIFAAVVLCAAYLCILLTGLLSLAQLTGLHQPVPLSSITRTLLWINAGFLIWRLLLRAGFVGALYGPYEAILSVPRTFVANIIGVLASRRACFAYVRHCMGEGLIWDKTIHRYFPDPTTRHG